MQVLTVAHFSLLPLVCLVNCALATLPLPSANLSETACFHLVELGNEELQLIRLFFSRVRCCIRRNDRSRLPRIHVLTGSSSLIPILNLGRCGWKLAARQASLSHGHAQGCIYGLLELNSARSCLHVARVTLTVVLIRLGSCLLKVSGVRSP